MQLNVNDPGMLEPSAPDGAGQDSPPEGLGLQASRLPKISRSTIAMGVMFCAGVGIIIALSSGADPQPAAASDAAVEAQVEQFLAHTEAKTGEETSGEALMEQFYSYASRRQLPADALRTDPFARAVVRRASVRPTDDDRPALVADAQRRASLQREFDNLSLQGIMATSQGATAIINGQFVATGATVGSFTVTAIRADHVELTCDQIDFTLSVQR
ncbi:MAG: hypothetical protein GX591_04615 [Planctomycetes bacterium]|nr:hypothetical protein [Planctomycetota bacterium]